MQLMTQSRHLPSLASLLFWMLITGSAVACSVADPYAIGCKSDEVFSSFSCRCEKLESLHGRNPDAPWLDPAQTAEEQQATPTAPTHVEEPPALVAGEALPTTENRILRFAPPSGPLPSSMTSCTSNQNCIVISGVCGNPMAVNRASIRDAAKIIADINQRAECARKSEPAAPATASCLTVQQYCVLVLPPAAQP